ncbi:MAG: class I SAM-dependent methyltransferase [Polyangiaceae bacterium]
MSTLHSHPVSTIIERLFSEADAVDSKMRERLSQMSPDERDALMAAARTDYRAFYGAAKDMFLPVSRETGVLLYMLARATRARSVVEYGTSFGLSTLFLAAAIKDNGGGLVIGSEFEPSKVTKARAHLCEAGLENWVEIREGDALSTLSRDLPETIDLVLLDGAKVLYSKILDLLEPKLADGALIVADNVDQCPDYVARVRAPGGMYVSVQFSKEVELSQRILAR